MATLDRQAVPGFFSSHRLYEMCRGLFAHFHTGPDNETLLRMMMPENCLGCYFFFFIFFLFGWSFSTSITRYF